MPTPRGPRWRKPPIPNTFWRGPAGREVLWARLEIKGRPIRWSLRLRSPLRAGDVETARSRIDARRQELTAAVHYGDARKRYVDVLAAWVDHIVREVSPSTALRYEVSLRQLKPFLVDCFIDELDRAKMREIVKARREQGTTDATIRRDLVALGSVIDFAIEEEDLADDNNPALARLRKIKERRDPIVLPEPRHIAMVIAEANPMQAHLIRNALTTGCRLSELTKAERPRIDHAHRQLTVVGKRNKLRVIDLDPFDGYETLRAVPARLGCKWVFWHDEGEAYRAASKHFHELVERVDKKARKAATAAGLAEPDFRPFTFHHLRHRHAVDWLKSGRSIYDLQQRLGHSSIKTTEIYLQYLTAEEIRVAKQGAADRQLAAERRGA